MRVVLAGLTILALVMSGCAKDRGAQSKSAVRAAIEEHLRQRPNVVWGNMTLEVQEVKFTGDMAEAEVRFRSKQSPELAVGVRYTLRKMGERWQVQSSSPMNGMGMNQHGGPGTRPPAPAPESPAPQASH